MNLIKNYYIDLSPLQKHKNVIYLTVLVMILSAILIIYTFTYGALFFCLIQIALFMSSWKEFLKATKAVKKLEHNSNNR